MFNPPGKVTIENDTKATIDRLIRQRREFMEDPQALPRADRYLMGHPVPAWQKTSAWGRVQQRQFIESLWRGIPVGCYAVCDQDWDEDAVPYPNSAMLINGQRRLIALENYLDNDFEVFGAFFSELSRGDQRRFRNTPFGCYVIHTYDEPTLRELRQLMNIGGDPGENRSESSQATDAQSISVSESQLMGLKVVIDDPTTNERSQSRQWAAIKGISRPAGGGSSDRILLAETCKGPHS